MLSKYSRRWVAFVLVVLCTAITAGCSGDPVVTAPVGSAGGLQAVSGGSQLAGSWTPVPSGTNAWLWGVWGNANDVIVVGNGGTALHLGADGFLPQATPTTGDFCDVWVASDGQAIAVGLDGAAAVYDGSNWVAVPGVPADNIFNTFGLPPAQNLATRTAALPVSQFVVGGLEAIAVGANGSISYYDGAALMPLSSPTSVGLFGTWVDTRSNIYVVGVGGTIIHFSGEVWSFDDSPASENLSSVWGSGPDDIYAAGDFGTLVHYDGTAWTQIDLGLSNNLYGVWGADANNVFVVGGAGLILHYDGTIWKTMDSGTTMDLFKVWGRSAGDVFAVGMNGTILRFGEAPADPCVDDDDVCDCNKECDDDCTPEDCDDGDICPTFDEACEWLGATVDTLCPPDGDWKNHGEYVKCVIKTTLELLHSDDIKACFDRKERKKLFLCVAIDRIKDHGGDGDAGDGCQGDHGHHGGGDDHGDRDGDHGGEDDPGGHDGGHGDHGDPDGDHGGRGGHGRR